MCCPFLFFMTYYTLEYNETQQCFHFNYGVNEPNTFGWVTIAENQENLKASLFCDLIEEKYKPDNISPIGNRKNKLSLKKVIEEWSWFEKIYTSVKTIVKNENKL